MRLRVASLTLFAASALFAPSAHAAITFSPTLQLALPDGSNAFQVATADFNGDGKPDIVICDQSSGDVTVFLNTTPAGQYQASFTSGSDFTSGAASPISVTAADFNGDGKPDIAVADEDSSDGTNGVQVLLDTTAPGSTVPTFKAHAGFNTASVGTPTWITAADINNDAKPDIAVANDSSGGPSGMSVLLNNAATGASAASFSTHQDFATSNAPQTIATADFNNDGRPDIAVGDFLQPTSANVDAWINETTTGSSTVTLGTRQSFTAGETPYAILTGDVNGDGKPDIVVGNQTSSSHPSVSVLRDVTSDGSTTPSFSGPTGFNGGAGIWDLALPDFDGDGRADIVTANANGGSANSLHVLANNGTQGGAPSFSGPTSVSLPGVSLGGTDGVASADFNGDGAPDIVAAGEDSAFVRLDAPALSPSTSGLTFGTQPQSTVSAGQSVTLTNAGSARLHVSATFSGADADDFLLSQNTCAGGSVAPGSTCSMTVKFAPNASGARSGTLVLTSNAPSSPDGVSLSGTGGSLPQGSQGPAGANGANGANGAQGAQGPPGLQGPAGRSAKITCSKKKVHRKTKTVCKVSTLAPGKTITAVHLALTRGHTPAARASAKHGGSLALKPVRRLRSGRYTLRVSLRIGRLTLRGTETVVLR
jgi:hypothetical protein